MIINYHGLSCFSVTAKPVSGDMTLVVDPYDNSTGLRFPRTLSADVLFSSKSGAVHGNVAAVGGTPFIIERPGEYEVKGMLLDAREAPLKDGAKHKILRVIAEGMSVGLLNALDRPLTNEELELFEGVDILVIPVGGTPVMTPKEAAEVIRQVEPRIVIPSFYAEKGLKESLIPLNEFKKELGPVPTEEVTKLKLGKKHLPQEDMKLVIINRG